MNRQHLPYTASKEDESAPVTFVQVKSLSRFHLLSFVINASDMHVQEVTPVASYQRIRKR